MAKLMLSFRDRLLLIHHMEEQPATIGRDPDCRISIDSLAVAPKHAEIMPTEAGFLLLALDPDYPVLLNNEQVDQASLHHGDQIQVGKHILNFSEDSLELPARHRPPTEAAAASEAAEDDVGPDVSFAYVQVQSGPRIGRFIVFRRAVTRLHRVGADDVIVTRYDDAYHLLRLGGDSIVKIDGKEVESDAEVVLQTNNLIEIDDIRLQFFSGEDSPPAEADDED